MAVQAHSPIAALKPGAPYFGGTLLSSQQHGQVRLFEVEYREKRSCPEHIHSAAFFSLLLQGRYAEKFGSSVLEYRPFDSGFHPTETVHSDSIITGQSRFFIAELSAPWMKMDHLPNGSSAACPEICSPCVSWSIAKLLCGHRERSLHCPLMVEEWVLKVLAVAAKRPVHSEKSRPGWLPRVVELLRSDFQSKLTLGQVADEVGLHPIYLSRAFRRYYGESLGHFVSRLRVYYAQSMLWRPEVSIAEIALMAGFADQSQLTRTFKRLTGTTPHDFRKIALPRHASLDRTKRNLGRVLSGDSKRGP